MGRRIAVMSVILVSTLFVATDSVWACKFLDRMFSRCRVPTDCCYVVCCQPMCCEPVVCQPPVCGPRAHSFRGQAFFGWQAMGDREDDKSPGCPGCQGLARRDPRALAAASARRGRSAASRQTRDGPATVATGRAVQIRHSRAGTCLAEDVRPGGLEPAACALQWPGRKIPSPHRRRPPAVAAAGCGAKAGRKSRRRVLEVGFARRGQGCLAL